MVCYGVLCFFCRRVGSAWVDAESAWVDVSVVRGSTPRVRGSTPRDYYLIRTVLVSRADITDNAKW